MTSSLRIVTESPLYQGADEQIAYIFNWTALGTPSAPTYSLYDQASGGTLNPASYFSGAAAVTGTFDVTLPALGSLTPGHHYWLVCGVTIAGQKKSAKCEIIGEV